MHCSEVNKIMSDIETAIVCCKSSNIVSGINEQIGRFSEYVNLLDISSVDFTRDDIFGERKIKAYWDKFYQLADGLDTAVNKLDSCHIALSDILTTLKVKKKLASNTVQVILQSTSDDMYKEIFNDFISVNHMMCTVDCLVIEYESLLDAVDNIRRTASAAFGQAILIAKMQRSFALFDVLSYIENYCAVKTALSMS